MRRFPVDAKARVVQLIGSPPITAAASSSRISYPSLRPGGQSSLTTSLLLSNANPLRWASRWGPPSAAFWRISRIRTFVRVGLNCGSEKRRNLEEFRVLSHVPENP